MNFQAISRNHQGAHIDHSAITAHTATEAVYIAEKALNTNVDFSTMAISFTDDITRWTFDTSKGKLSLITD